MPTNEMTTMPAVWLTSRLRWLAVVAIAAASSFASHRACLGQANVEVEIEHLWRLHDEGKWLEALDETKPLLALMEKNGADEGGPLADTFLTFCVFRATFASEAGDLEVAREILELIDDLSANRAFTTAVRRARPAEGRNNDDAAKKRLRQYELVVDLRNFYLIDAQIRTALANQDYAAAENLVATSIRARRASGSRAAMLEKKNREGRILSPKQLAELSTFQPHRQATLLYLAKDQSSRAKTYFDNMTEDVEQTIFEAFHDTSRTGTGDNTLCPEWPSGAQPPSVQQREASRLRALTEDTRGRLALAHGDLAGAETAFTAALDYWKQAYGGDHPEAIPAMLGSAEISLKRVREASSSRDAKTYAVRARKAERLLKTAQQVAEPALASASPVFRQIGDLLAEAEELASASTVNFDDLEAAEQAATAALRSMAKFVVSQQSVAASPATPKSAPSQAAAADKD